MWKQGVTRYSTGEYPYTSPVGSFPANGYGLCDMAGNVWEWCWDRYPGLDAMIRVVRGGSWHGYAERCRVGHRDDFSPNFANNDYIGFRAVLSLGQQ